MEERYVLTVTHKDDSTTVVSGLTLEETLQIVAEETYQPGPIWFKLEKI